MKTSKLLIAKKNKKDEFYTLLEDIDRELKHYKNYFKDKIIYCPCDDPLKSNFYKYFSENFKELGLKKLISSCYIQNSKGYYFEYNGEEDKTVTDVGVSYFKEDGDFRSKEVLEFLKQADIIVTNPPFSLFREFLDVLKELDKKFLIIGNINSITYKTTYELIKEDKAWLGINIGRQISGFIVPNDYEMYGTESKINSNNQKIISPNNCLWLTNLENERRNKKLKLTKSFQINKELYSKFDNFDGINIDRTENIPKDYTGVMGVPLTFLHKHNPNQFEIIGFRKGNDGKDLKVNGKTKYFIILIKNKNKKQ